MPREMLENERSTAINPSEGVDETVSLSDRFGLWIGFHNCSQDDYLDMVRGYAAHYRLPVEDEVLARRGARLGDRARRTIGARRVSIHSGCGRAASACGSGKRMAPSHPTNDPSCPALGSGLAGPSAVLMLGIYDFGQGETWLRDGPA